MTKPVFLYANGTAFFSEILGFPVGGIGGGADLTLDPVSGRPVWWDGAITNDPFWRCLDEQKWDVYHIDYPAAAFPMGPSIQAGADTCERILLSIPYGTPFMLGGYSQGAAVMSHVYRRLKESTGSLHSFFPFFKGATLFGNPMREINFTAPEVSWSGAWDVPGSSFGGGGCFPDLLTGCEYGKWREYVNVNEVITSTGTSTQGTNWRNAVGWLTGQISPADAVAGLVSGAYFDGIGAAGAIGDYGHVRYPDNPPMSTVGQTFPDGTYTSYELALTYIESVFQTLNITSILPPSDPLMDRTWTTYLPSPV